MFGIKIPKIRASFQKQMNIDFITKCGTVKRTSIQMMTDRGYETSTELFLLQKTDLQVGLYFLKKCIAEKRSLCTSMNKIYEAETIADGPPKLAVYFLDRNFDETKNKDKMISTLQFKNVLREFAKINATRCLLILPIKMSPQARKEAQRSHLGIMHYEELVFNVARHFMVPPHIGVSEKDAAEFFASRKIEPHQLPVLRDSDPIAKYYGYSRGTLVKIERPGWTVYRVVGSGGVDEADSSSVGSAGFEDD